MQTPPVAISEAVQKELRGESILWADSPTPWGYARRQWKGALFGIPFTAFAIFWTFGAENASSKGDTSSHLFFILWGLMFVGIGMSMLLAPFWYAWAARNAFYVVTNERVIIFEKLFFTKIQSFSPFVVSGYERITRGGSGGDLIFMQIQRKGGKGSTYIKEVGFLGLADCSDAELAIKRLISSANKT